MVNDLMTAHFDLIYLQASSLLLKIIGIYSTHFSRKSARLMVALAPNAALDIQQVSPQAGI